MALVMGSYYFFYAPHVINKFLTVKPPLKKVSQTLKFGNKKNDFDYIMKFVLMLWNGTSVNKRPRPKKCQSKTPYLPYFQIITQILHLLYTMNSVINPLIYSWLRQDFNVAFRKLLHLRVPKQELRSSLSVSVASTSKGALENHDHGHIWAFMTSWFVHWRIQGTQLVGTLKCWESCDVTHRSAEAMHTQKQLCSFC